MNTCALQIFVSLQRVVRLVAGIRDQSCTRFTSRSPSLITQTRFCIYFEDNLSKRGLQYDMAFEWDVCLCVFVSWRLQKIGTWLTKEIYTVVGGSNTKTLIGRAFVVVQYLQMVLWGVSEVVGIRSQAMFVCYRAWAKTSVLTSSSMTLCCWSWLSKMSCLTILCEPGETHVSISRSYQVVKQLVIVTYNCIIYTASAW